MVEEMEAELTESSEIISKTDNLAVTEEADVDETIPILFFLTQAYQKIMDIDIDKISSFKKEKKLIQ